MPIQIGDAPKVLPKHAKEIFVSAFNSAYDGTCKEREDRDACSSKIAWSAVKKRYKKDGDKWVAKMDLIKDFSFTITRTSYNKEENEMRWFATASNTDKDFYDECMTTELFKDFITRIKANELAPESYRSEAWQGGYPYVSVSHYPDLSGKGIAGDVTSLYIDGKCLKAKGTFRDTELGRTCFKAINDDLYGEKSEEEKIRISIAFLDYGHLHGDKLFMRRNLTDTCEMCKNGINDKKYVAGLLVHLALTRVPANKGTEIELEVNKSMKTKKEDAASIVGEELAEELENEETSFVGKSEALVVKAEEEESVNEEETSEETESEPEQEESVEEEPVEDVVSKSDIEEYKPFGGATNFAEADEWMDAQEQRYRFYDAWYTFEALASNILSNDFDGDRADAMKSLMNGFKDKLETKAMVALSKLEDLEVQRKEEDQHILAESYDSLKERFDEVRKSSLGKEEKLKAMQDEFNALASTIQENIELPASEVDLTEEKSVANALDLEAVIARVVQPVYDQLAVMQESLNGSKTVETYRQNIPQRRSVVAKPFAGERDNTKKESITPKLRKLVEDSIYS